MSDSVRPHRRQPIRLPVPGILQARTLGWVAISSAMHETEKWKWSRSVVSNSSWPHGLQPTRLLRPWDFPGKSTGMGCHCLLHLSCLFFLKFRKRVLSQVHFCPLGVKGFSYQAVFGCWQGSSVTGTITPQICFDFSELESILILS